MSPIQTLSQSLDHWQFLYIVALTIAFASTALIVVFAFHMKEHQRGLKISNYFYVIASLFAVISTIVIVNKTKSLDAEKDRQSRAISDAAALQTAHADADAKDSLAKAVEAQLAIDEMKPDVASLKSSQTATAQSLQSIQQSTALRKIKFSNPDAKLLGQFSDIRIIVVSQMSDGDAMQVDGQLQALLHASGFGKVENGSVMGPSADSPLLRSGIHIFFGSNPKAHAFANALGDLLRRSGLKEDVSPGDTQTLSTGELRDFNGPPIDDSDKVVIFVGPKS